MGIPCYLAFTAEEFRDFSRVPESPAWMGCSFSPEGSGLSGFPPGLPPGAVLTVNDSTPMGSHDCRRIFAQLDAFVRANRCRAVVLDLQRQGDPRIPGLIRVLEPLPCPVVVSQWYAGESRAVLLEPVPPSVPLERHLEPWLGRELWLEIAAEGERITLTEQGCTATSLPHPDTASPGFAHKALHCHYRTALAKDRAEFTLWRTAADLADLLQEAQSHGVTAALGLYQQFRTQKLK